MTCFVKATYHPNEKVAEFIADDGRHLLRSGGSLQWRICNAGDLSSPVTNGIPTPKKTKGYIGFANPAHSEHQFFIFPDYETGRAELKANLLRRYGTKTLSEAIAIYAPKRENNTEKYLKDLGSLTGIKPDTKIGDLSNSQLNSLMDSIERLEGYHRDAESRKETWVTVSTIHATDGIRPVSGEEIVVRANGKETTLKSNDVGRFPPIIHGTGTTEVHHKTIDGDLVKVGELPADKGQHFSLITTVAEYFGMSGPVKAPANPITQKRPLQYPVQPGDTLGKLAVRFKTDVATLKKDNHLAKDVIFPGQVLGIYGPPPASLAAATPKKAAPKATKPIPAPEVAAASKAKPAARPATPTISARSKEGQGEPLALIEPTEGLAPWMKYALAEAMQFKGINEAFIEKTINFHTEIKDHLVTMVGDENAWCAAFANWCLMQAGYPIENPKETGFFDRAGDMGRAEGFRHSKVKGGTPVANPLYIQVDEPAYGVIAIETSPTGHGHHVGFVYGITANGWICLLGGNQSSTIKFSNFNPKEVAIKTIKIKNGKNVETIKMSSHLEYFIPASYMSTYTKQDKALQKIIGEDLNEFIGISKATQKKDRQGGTR